MKQSALVLKFWLIVLGIAIALGLVSTVACRYKHWSIINVRSADNRGRPEIEVLRYVVIMGCSDT